MQLVLDANGEEREVLVRLAGAEALGIFLFFIFFYKSFLSFFLFFIFLNK